MKDYYKVLEIPYQAGEEKIKKAYRRLSKKYHPDTNPGNPEAEKRFMEILEAYDILKDPEKRQKYDKQLKRGNGNHEAGGRKKSASAFHASPNIDFNNMEQQFAQFFGFRPGSEEINKEALNKKKKKTNPLDMTDMFEEYMGVKNKRK